MIVSFLDLDRLPAALPTSGRTSDPEGENITHIFFPVRRIPSKSRRQLGDSTHGVRKANEQAEVKLGRWLDCVDEIPDGKCHVERDKFKFSVMKDLHPLVEWRTISSLPQRQWWRVADEF